MTDIILAQDDLRVNDIIKWITVIDPTTDLQGVPDGVYPFNGLSDKWAIVDNERQIGWTRDYGDICLIHAEVLRVKREHAQRCPQDVIPFSREADDYGLQEPTL